MNNFYFLNNASSIGSTIFLLLPTLLIVGLFVYFKKKQDTEGRERNRFGRRGGKDHTWQILKEYHKKTKQIGKSIEEKYLFERPKPNDLHDALVKGMQFRYKYEEKTLGKKVSIFSKKPKYPKRFNSVEDYFEQLEKKTLEYRKGHTTTSKKVEEIRENINKKQNTNRKRYVILYKSTTKQKSSSDGKAVEVELIKQNTKDGKIKDTVVLYEDLNVGMEMLGIEPLLSERIYERKRKEEEKKKRERNVQKKAKFRIGFKNIFRKNN